MKKWKKKLRKHLREGQRSAYNRTIDREVEALLRRALNDRAYLAEELCKSIILPENKPEEKVDTFVRDVMRDTDHDAMLKIQELLDGVEWQTITIEHVAEVMINAGYRIRDLNDNDLRFSETENPWRIVEGDDGE